MSTTIIGSVVRLLPDRGFGFVRSGTTEYFLHLSDLQDCELLELKAGDRLEFVPEETDKGWRAREIHLLPPLSLHTEREESRTPRQGRQR